MTGPADLRALPKAHLHVHLDGAMRPSTLAELAEETDITVPIIRGYGSFAHFSATITAVQQVVRGPTQLQRLVEECLEDAARDGAIWVEPSLWPGAFAPQVGTFRDVLELVLDTGQRTARRLRIGFGLMVAANRDRGPHEATELAHLADALQSSGVVSFGLDGDESAAPAEDFVDAFAIARAAGLLATPHAGELAGPASVRTAMEQLGARRILHGVRAVEDPLLLRELADRGVCLDVCPTSNVLLGVVSDRAAHPLSTLLAAGVRCSVNADDPLLFSVSLLEEYERCRDVLGVTNAQLATIAQVSLDASGAPRALVESTSRAIENWLAVAGHQHLV